MASRCSYCGAPVWFVPSEATGSLMILDPQTVEGGNVVLVRGGDGVQRARVLNRGDHPGQADLLGGQALPDDVEATYRAHQTVCARTLRTEEP